MPAVISCGGLHHLEADVQPDSGLINGLLIAVSLPANVPHEHIAAMASSWDGGLEGRGLLDGDPLGGPQDIPEGIQRRPSWTVRTQPAFLSITFRSYRHLLFVVVRHSDHFLLFVPSMS